MADWPYSTAAWQRLRRAKLSLNPLCEICERRGKNVPARAVDHIVSIASGGDAFPTMEGLMSLCWSCHSIKTNAKDRAGGKGVAEKGCGPDGLPLDPEHAFHDRETHPATVVCGPPGSGKSTYVARHRKTGDLVLDLDTIMAALSGEAIYDAPGELLPFAWQARDAVLERLRRAHGLRHAWIIMGGAKRADRMAVVWSLNARVVMLDVSAAECLQRIKDDKRRPDMARARHEAAVATWWDEYERDNPLEGREAVEGRPAGYIDLQFVPQSKDRR